MIIFLVILGTSGFLRILEIEIIGALRYPESDIVEASGISRGDNLLFTDTKAAVSQIKATMPYIRDAEITRQLPYSIRIEVTESIAIATIAYQFETLVIDMSGRVLERANEAPDDLIEIRGFLPGEVLEGSALKAQLGDETKLQFLLDVIAAIAREGIQGDVSYLDITNISNINFSFLGRYRITLGSATDLRQKFSTLPAAIAAVEEMESPSVTGTFRVGDGGGWLWSKDN